MSFSFIPKSILWLCLTGALILSTALPSQAADEDKPFNFTFFGFVKNDAFFDTRQMVAARQGQFSLFPSPVIKNDLGTDRNEGPLFHMLAIQSRLSMIVTGPDAFGASSRGFIEGAFFGNIESDINGFRLRHAFVELVWDGRHKLLFGQFWHPMFAETAVPGVVAFNTGAPFKPFSRNPQIRYTFSPGDVSFILAAMSQIDFVSQGGSMPLRRSGIPNLHGQVRYSSGSFGAGAGLDFKSLKPEFFSGEETLNSLAGTVYGTYSRNSFRAMAQFTYGQNLFDHLMLGGFALNQPFPGSFNTYDLINITTRAVWADISTGNTFRAGLFFGFTENMGADEDFNGGPDMRGGDIAWVWRVSPRIELNSGPVRLSLEAEYSEAGYGLPDNRGVVSDTDPTSNLRLMFSTYFFF